MMEDVVTISNADQSGTLSIRDRSRFSSPAFAGMAMAIAFLAREPFLICLRRLFLRPRPFTATEKAARLLSLRSLRGAIIGHGKRYITNMFGPPPTCTGGQCPVWYYPISASDKLAMAISFHDGRAAIVEFFQSP